MGVWICLARFDSLVAQEASRGPNIIFIMADDLGYGDLGCYGQRWIRTPNIDQMAREGTRFTQAYAGAPVCAPSRSVLMTGLHTGHTTIRGNFGRGGVQGLGGGSGRVPLKETDVTVAQALRASGYATGMAGKWGLGEPNTTGMPGLKGFDEWMGYLNQRRAHSYYPDYLWSNGLRLELLANKDGRQGVYSHDLFTGFALGFIRKHADRPFFLYLPYTIPHSALQVPDLGPYANQNWTDDEKAYAAMVTRMDTHVGMILDLLKELGIDRRTIVFFCSDNGAANRYEGVFDSSGPLSGRKRDLYEGGLRTPMIVRWPGRVQAGVVSGLMWGFQDFLPTALDLAGNPIPEEAVDGASIAPSLVGSPQDFSDRIFYWEFFERGFQQAARWRNWKAIRFEAGAPIQLFDLDVDLRETQDVAADNPELVARFERYFEVAREESPHWPISDDAEPANDDREPSLDIEPRNPFVNPPPAQPPIEVDPDAEPIEIDVPSEPGVG